MNEFDKSSNKADELYKQGKLKATEAYNDLHASTESLISHAKDKANEVYEGSKDKINELQKSVHEHSDELVRTIRQKPLKSVLIAGGIGFLISLLVRK
ncbi:MAG TPA: hypothetical protein PK657_08135 [Legionella sp.]|nr:hypothetical protein [Legionella sp.]